MKLKITAILLILCVLFAALAVPASAITWDGSSAGGGGGGLPGTAGGYALRSTDLNTVCIGYRFSVVNSSGGTKAGPIDVFRNTSGGNAAIANNYVFSTKQNKKQLITNQNNSVSTVKSTTNCLYESNMGFASALPAPSGIGTWQNNVNNLNRVFSYIGVGNVDNLKNGDKLLIEPLWDAKLKNVYHSVTTTELAIFGKWLLGVNSDGGASTTSDSWGFISRFTNREFPNSLFTPNGQGLWTGVSAISSSTRATFYTIINSGYGVGIGYTETRPDFSPNLSVNTCEAWRGSLSTRTFHYGSSNGSAFGNYTYANGYPLTGDSIWFNIYFPAESQAVTVRQYVRLQGAASWTTRDTTLSSGNSASQYYSVALSPTTIDAGRSSYVIEAKTDYMNGSTILKSGAVKTFYIPVKPIVTRYQVTIFDVTNTQVARNGAAGQSGSVYVGQKVYPKYRYTSNATFTTNYNYAVNLNGANDFTLMSTGINSNSPIERNSSHSPYVVPNLTSLPIEMVTSWSADSGRTREATNVPIPVIKADAELKEIKLIDAATGGYVSGTVLTANQKVTPQYTYKNNTSVRIFVEGYDNDQARLGGSSTAYYSIPANGEIVVNGKQLTVPTSATTYSVWGGVYLDGAGRGNTGWESNGSNNAKTVTYSVANPNLSVNTCEAWRGSLNTQTFRYGTSNGTSISNYTYANGYPIMDDTIWFNVNFPAQSQNVTVRQYVRLQGASTWTTRDVTLSSSNTSSQWFGFAPSPNTVGNATSGYTIEAKIDQLSGSTVISSGAVKTFYIPVRPKINRYQVSLIDITNIQVARNGELGQSGSVYVGQKVNFQYTYTSSSAWTSTSNYSASVNNASDFSSLLTINSYSPLTRIGSLNPYVVPNLTSLPIEMVTSWSSDKERTREATSVPIPVIKADVELKDIRLIDVASNTYVTDATLTPNQKVKPQYTFKNNTNIKIFVEGYDNTRLGSNATYSISANGEINVTGKEITVPSSVTTYSVTGSVYLDGAGRGNTSWESNGSNNTKTVIYAVGNPLKVQTITPNSKYREGTEVVTSFTVQNPSITDYTTDNSVSVRFTASNGSTTLYTTTKSGVVIPASGDNLVYFKWTVPAGLNGANITLKAEVISGGVVMDTKTLSHGSEKKPESQTPDTQYEKNRPPEWVRLDFPPARTGAHSAQWSEWVYEGGAFVKKTYGLNLPDSPLAKITPDENSTSDYHTTPYMLYMPSGYGFTADWTVAIATLSGTQTPTSAMKTGAQTAHMYFPEFEYSMAAGEFRVLERTAANRFQFPANPYAKNNARLHFTPIWFPNSTYRGQTYVGDIWTPAGMLSRYYYSSYIQLQGNIYDDWHVGR